MYLYKNLYMRKNIISLFENIQRIQEISNINSINGKNLIVVDIHNSKIVKLKVVVDEDE
jgi:hypothetical protein